MPCPYHPCWLDHSNYTWQRVWSSSFCSFLQPPFIPSLFGPNILLSTLFTDTLSLCSSLIKVVYNVENLKFLLNFKKFPKFSKFIIFYEVFDNLNIIKIFHVFLNFKFFWNFLNIFHIFENFQFLLQNKVKLPLQQVRMPIALWDVEAVTFSRQLAHRWWWVCQLYMLATPYSQEDSWYSFLLEAELTPGP
jgi:hypothetical protein